MKFTETNEWYFGADGEYFDSEAYTSKEEAIEACKYNIEEGYVGRKVKVEFDEEDVPYIETGFLLGEALFEEIGDVSESWEMSAEDEKELSKILAKTVIDYIDKHNLQPTCFKVVDVEEVSLDDGHKE